MTVELASGVFLAATGNRFFVVDATMREPFSSEGAWSRDVRAFCSSVAPSPDGVLVLSTSQRADVRMRVYNRDGSRAEACGNGLRCIAKLAVERGYVTRSDFTIETDVGDCTAHARADAGTVSSVRAEVGTPRILARDERIDLAAEHVLATLVDLGNPHCVVLTPDVDAVPLERIGAELETHERFPGRTNVELVQRCGNRLRVRIWERGVGETLSCGTGVAASLAAVYAGPTRSDVETRGGVLAASWDGDGPVALEGAVEEWSPRRVREARPLSLD